MPAATPRARARRTKAAPLAQRILACCRCAYEWLAEVPVAEHRPRRCPRCRSPKWDSAPRADELGRPRTVDWSQQ